MSMAQPVSKLAPGQVFDMSEVNRVAYMKSLGARNLNPPLPRSPYLRNKVTGRVLPWNELLSEQTELMECCDSTGNTDPEAWGPLVPKDSMTEEARQDMIARMQSQLLATASAHGGRASVTPAAPIVPNTTTLPAGAVFADELSYEELQSRLQALAQELD